MLMMFSALEKAVFAALVGGALLVAWLLASAPQGGEEWEAYKARHHCVSVGAEGGNNRPGWRCDDGKVYYLWRQQR